MQDFLDLDLDNIYAEKNAKSSNLQNEKNKQNEKNVQKVDDRVININFKTPTFNGTIATYDNVIDKTACDFILKYAQDRCTFTDSRINSRIPDNGIVSEERTSKEISITGNEPLKSLDDLLYEIFKIAIQKYAQDMSNYVMKRENNPIINVTTDDGYTLLKYSPNGHYNLHVDQNTDENGMKKLRIVSALLYLNDDFEGGGTFFPLQNVTMTPKPGRLVLFPSSYSHVHEAKPVIRGTKYAIVTWYR